MTEKLKTSLMVIGAMLLVANFIALVIALTDIIPQSPLKEYGFIIGISFVSIGGLMRQVFLSQKGN